MGEDTVSIPKSIISKYQSLDQWCILSCYRGSIAHGTYRPNSDPTSIDDKDVLACCVPPLHTYFGLNQFGSHGTQEIRQDEWDIVVYEARKFISLLKQGNPNVLSVLWLEPKHYIKKTTAGEMLLGSRNLFVGKHVYKSFTGYAYSQLHRMTHYKFEGYMGEKRKALVDKFGYDTKNAAHLIRLLRMGIEFLTDGRLYVEREDASQLLEIKRGEWKLENVLALSNTLFTLSEEAYIKSTLPVGPDEQGINDLCVQIVREGLNV